MKTKLLTFLLICFFANIITAQKLMKPADLKMADVATYLKNNGYTIEEQDETYIKIVDQENASLFIDFDPDKKYLHFNIKITLKDKTKKDKIDQLISEINDLKMISAQYVESDNSVFFQYYLWISHGFTMETLKDAVLEFYLYQGDSYNLDEDKIFNYQ